MKVCNIYKMKVILIEQVDKLGTVGDTVNVKSGYARNYLLPNSLALRATKQNTEYFETQKAELVKKNETKKAEAKKIFDQINGFPVNVIRMSSDEGKLYGSVTTKDVAEALTAKYANEFKKSSIIMGNAVREIGIYDVKVRVHPEYNAVISLCIGQSDAAIKKMLSDQKSVSLEKSKTSDASLEQESANESGDTSEAQSAE
jgi:large subunit ribosomal protein L9